MFTSLTLVFTAPYLLQTATPLKQPYKICVYWIHGACNYNFIDQSSLGWWCGHYNTGHLHFPSPLVLVYKFKLSPPWRSGQQQYIDFQFRDKMQNQIILLAMGSARPAHARSDLRSIPVGSGFFLTEVKLRILAATLRGNCSGETALMTQLS